MPLGVTLQTLWDAHTMGKLNAEAAVFFKNFLPTCGFLTELPSRLVQCKFSIGIAGARAFKPEGHAPSTSPGTLSRSQALTPLNAAGRSSDEGKHQMWAMEVCSWRVIHRPQLACSPVRVRNVVRWSSQKNWSQLESSLQTQRRPMNYSPRLDATCCMQRPHLHSQGGHFSLHGPLHVWLL